jgi:DNA-binding response OmpR family regulator
MPGVCGLDVIQATRTAGMRIPAVLITAFGAPEIRDRARTLGAMSVLDKPFEINDLLTMVRRLVRPDEAGD